MEFKRDEEIERKVIILKQQLQELLNTHGYEVYVLLKKILKYRQEQINGYDNKDLYKEKGIDLTDDQVRYYMNFEYISSKSKKLMGQGKLKGSTFLFIMRKSIEFRKPEIQDNVIEKYLKGEINSSTISHSDINKIIQGDINFNSEEVGYKVYYKLKEIKRCLEQNEDILEIPKLSNLIINEVKKIDNFVNGKEANWLVNIFERNYKQRSKA